MDLHHARNTNYTCLEQGRDDNKVDGLDGPSSHEVWTYYNFHIWTPPCSQSGSFTHSATISYQVCDVFLSRWFASSAAVYRRAKVCDLPLWCLEYCTQTSGSDMRSAFQESGLLPVETTNRVVLPVGP
jgi:hypothetical protein